MISDLLMILGKSIKDIVLVFLTVNGVISIHLIDPELHNDFKYDSIRYDGETEIQNNKY